jgi:hypothetical protein
MQQHPPLSFPADPEHGGLRFAVLACFVGVATLTALITSALLANVPFNGVLSVALGVGAAILITRTVEANLKQRWPSGRTVEIEGDTVRLALKGQTQRAIDGAQEVDLALWRFAITRRTRVPRGWYVVALAIVQDSIHVPVYTFMSPDDFNDLPLAERFVQLSAPKTDKKDAGDLRLAGQQRRLREAEVWRWNEGAELSREDFNTYLGALQDRFEWMVKPS